MKSRQDRIKEQEKLLGLYDEVKDSLMKIPGVVDVAIGLKEKAGDLTEEIVFQVFVQEKKQLSDLDPAAVVPKEIKGIKTDVMKLPKGGPRIDNSEHRPIKGGIQIGNGKGHVGTLGWFGRLTFDNTLVLLTNEHVLYSDGAKAGDKIGQPDVNDYCCCCCAYTEGIIGDILNPGINNNEVDCAIATVNRNAVVDYILNNAMDSTEIEVNNTGTVVVGDAVRKVGRTSGFTNGVISSINGPGGGKSNQLLIRPAASETYMIQPANKKAFSAPGDSGSIIVNAANEIIGLLWGGDSSIHPTDDITFANHIQKVLDALANAGIEIALENTPADRSAGVKREMVSTKRLDLDIRTKLLQTEKGSLVVQLFEVHQKEILRLINHNKKVTIAWQRNQGPAFMAHIMNSSKDPSYQIPINVKEISRQDLIIRMAAVFRETGSEALKQDLEKYIIDLMQYSYELNTVESFFNKVSESSMAELN